MSPLSRDRKMQKLVRFGFMCWFGEPADLMEPKSRLCQVILYFLVT